MPRKPASTSMAGDLFRESLITEDVKMAIMSLNITEQQKAEKLIDCVRTQVAITPEKIHVFIKVLRRHGGEEVAKTLEEKLKSPRKSQQSSKLWLACLSSILLALVVIMGCAVYFYQDSSPGKSLSLPVLKQELIGREEEMEVIMGYFRNSEVEVVTLYGQAGFGKSEIALHVGHRMLQLGVDVYYIKVEYIDDAMKLEDTLMAITETSYTDMKLMKWGKGLIKKTLLILDNVDGQHWVSDTSLQQLKELFLNPLLENTFNLQVLITSQQDMMTTHVYRSYRLYSLSTKDCVHLMVNHSRHAESESDTADTDHDDLKVICNLVGNVPYASKILAKAISSGTSAKYIIQELSEKSKSKNLIVAEKADKVDKDRLLSAIELAFQFVKKECQISTFFLIKFWYSSFTLDQASRHITVIMSKYFNYTDFDLYKCLLELTAKSFLELRKDWHHGNDEYLFHELSVDYLQISNSERTEVHMAYWKRRLSSGYVSLIFRPDGNDYICCSISTN